MKKLMIFFIAIFFIMSMSAYAGNNGAKAFGDIYYIVLDAGQDPAYPPVDPPWTKVTGAVNIQVNDGQNLFIAVENSLVQQNATDLTLKLTGNGLMEFGMDDVWADPPTTVVSMRGAAYLSNTFASYPYRFVPQPDWHYFKLANAAKGTVNVTQIEAAPHCYVPSLTTYGIAALALLLIASSVFVIYRRRKAVTA